MASPTKVDHDLLQLGRYDRHMVECLHDTDGESIVGVRLRQVGGIVIEIHNKLFNFRVVTLDVRYEDLIAMTGHAWCYPKEIGYPGLATHVWAWDIDTADIAAVDPPGPWIKAVHSGVYREGFVP